MREQNIIMDLKNSNEYRSLDYFAKRYDVSTRTISNDIKYLMQISKTYGFELMLKRKEGYYLKVIDEANFQKFLEQKEKSANNPMKDRIASILLKLLLATSYVTQDEIAEELQISKSMVKLDMNKVEERLQEYELSLDKKAHFGVCISGSMKQRKLCLMELMESDSEVEQYIAEQVDVEEMKQIDKALINLLREYELNTNYVEMLKLDRYLKITVIFRKLGIDTKDALEHVDPVYVQIAKRLATAIVEIAELELQEQEIDDFAQFLRKKTKPNKVSLEYDEQLKTDIYAFLVQADIEYKSSFSKDDEFLQSLFSHVSLLVDRLHQSISFDNPLVKEISAKYPVVFNISIKFANMLEERYHVKTTQDEIGFIATHFAAHLEKEQHSKLHSFHRIAIICSSGGGSAFLIKLKMETVFPKSKIQTFSFMELDHMRTYEPDIIFTIKPLDESFNVPIVVIKELLDDDDMKKIKHMFEFCGPQLGTHTVNDFHSLFHKDAFWMLEHGTYQEILQHMAQQVEDLGYAQDGYRAYVMQREEVLSTIYYNGVAIPHPIEMCSDDNMIAMGIVKHDLRQDEKAVKLIFLVSLEKGNLEIHQNISRVLFQVMSDEKLVDKLRNSESYEDFMKNMSMLHF